MVLGLKHVVYLVDIIKQYLCWTEHMVLFYLIIFTKWEESC
jgi:hypothetical protein